MRIITQSLLIRCIIFSLVLTWLLSGAGLAQLSAPLGDVNIALWPEYDRAEVLVIFRGRIADNASLPASVSFNLPSTIGTLHAMAYVDEEQGALLNIEDYDFIEVDDGKVLSFVTPSRQFQFEYYSSDSLSINGDVRDLSFSFTPSADINNLTFELQEPTMTQAFTSDPPPSTTQARQNGLTYALYEMGRVPVGEIRSLTASYTRSTDKLSVDTLGGVSIPSSPEQGLVEVGGGGLRDNLGPILIGVGVLLLSGALIYWFWSQRAVVVPEPTPRQQAARSRRTSRKRKPSTSRGSRPPASAGTLAPYCHRCGTKLRDDAQFCHACGAERRTG
jgi:hypothetical protein